MNTVFVEWRGIGLLVSMLINLQGEKKDVYYQEYHRKRNSLL